MLTCTPKKAAPDGGTGMTSGRWRFDGDRVWDNLTGNVVPQADNAGKWPSVTHFACYYGDHHVKVIGIYQTDTGFIWQEKPKS